MGLSWLRKDEQIISYERLKKLVALEGRVKQLYWLSEFSFIGILQNYLQTGYSVDDKFYNISMGDFRKEFRVAIDSWDKVRTEKINELNLEVQRLKYENDILKKSIEIKKEV